MGQLSAKERKQKEQDLLRTDWRYTVLPDLDPSGAEHGVSQHLPHVSDLMHE